MLEDYGVGVGVPGGGYGLNVGVGVPGGGYGLNVGVAVPGGGVIGVVVAVGHFFGRCLLGIQPAVGCGSTDE